MKLLIAYDGSNCAEAALDELVRAGLPDQTEALVLTVSEEWLAAAEKNNVVVEDETSPFDRRRTRPKALSQANALARHARQRLKNNFPTWKIKTEAVNGSAARKIMKKSNQIGADLIVVGAHGRGSLGCLTMGSVSQKVLFASDCSVRVARGRGGGDPVPSRILIAYDGSPGADWAIETVAARRWRDGSQFRLVVVTDRIAPSAIGRFVPPVVRWVEAERENARERIEKIARRALEKLRGADLSATLAIRDGNPKEIIVEEAADWAADCVFAGATCSGGAVDEFLLGSVSAAIAGRAHCSVEVARKAAREHCAETSTSTTS